MSLDAEAVEWEQYEKQLVDAAFDLMTAFEEVFGASQEYDECTNRPIPEHTTVELFLLRDEVELANTTRLGMRWFGGHKLFLWQLATAINLPLIPFAEHFATWRTATPAEIRGLATFIRHVAPHMDTAVDIWTELGRGQTVEAWHVLRKTILSALRNEHDWHGGDACTTSNEATHSGSRVSASVCTNSNGYRGWRSISTPTTSNPARA